MSVWRDTRPPGRLTLWVDGAATPAREGETVAVALLRAGHLAFGRHPKTGRPAGPACLMGACFGCLVTVDGRPGVQACLASARDGQRVELGGTPGAAP